MKDHDVQAMSDADLHVYEAVAARATAGESTDPATVTRLTGFTDPGVRRSLAKLVALGALVPSGDGYRLGEHTFEVDY
ncbi:hypothetical protein [Nonomuraea sp. NPDC050310]|uniref:hypothetical protein n=1 Tax=Nonomuraea sp. NPDC050310 TaxID=3154935 RepID=UPI003405975E